MKRFIVYCILFGLINFTFSDPKTSFILLSILIGASSIFESLILFRKYGITFLLSPFVVCCLYLFCISFGFSNFIFILPSYEKYYEFFVYAYFTSLEDFHYWLFQGLNYVFIGFLCLLAGYKIEEKTHAATNFTHYIFRSRLLLVKDFNVRLWKIIALWLVSCAAKIYAIAMGLYGFTASSIALEENKGTIQLIYYGTIVSKAALFLLSLLYFLRPKSFTVKFSLLLVLVIELIFGLLSGFKSQVMFPFIIFFFASIIALRTVKIKFIIPIVISVFVAYALVQPMREASYGYGSDKKVDAAELIEIASTGIKNQSIEEEDAVPFLYVFMYRNSLSMFVALSAREKDYKKRFYPEFDIQRKMLFSPVLAYVPRALWLDKPIISNGGVIYNREVLGAPDDNNVSIAISPVGYFLLGTHYDMLYIIGFFFLLGMLQYYIFHLFLDYGLGGLIVCLGMILTFGILEEPYTILIAYFKELPLFIVFQFLFLYKFKRSIPHPALIIS